MKKLDPKLKITIITDAQMGIFIPKCDLVLFGAEVQKKMICRK